MANDIKQRIVLEGEKEYSAAIKDAKRSLNVLRSELKAETAELGKNATEQEKNAVKVRNLQKQIKEQEKVVRTYEKALDEVREKYADNEEAIAKWEIKLNDARTALANMRNGLEDVGKDMKNVGSSMDGGIVAAKSFADSLDRIAQVGESVSSSISSAFSGIASSIREVVGDTWASMMDIAARANQWTDIATMWNTTTANIQKWYHSVESEGKDFARLSNYVTKIVTGDQEKIASATNVSAEAYEDQWEYAMAVMDSLSKMDLDDAMAALDSMGIKGAKQEGWIDMLKAWGDIQGNTAEFDVTNGGKGLTEENLQKADQLAKDVAKIEQSWMALKDNWYLELGGDLALNIVGNIQNIIDALHEYFQATDEAGKQEALRKIKENIIEAFKGIRDAIQEGIKMLNDVAKELQESDDPTAQTFGKILGAITSALQWIADEKNWQAVKAALTGIFGVFLLGKIAHFASLIGSIATNLGIISGSSVLSGAGAAGAGAAGAASSAVLPVALAAITCGPLLYRLVHGTDEQAANETAQTFEHISALLHGREENEVTADVVGDVLNGRRSFLGIMKDAAETTINNLKTGNRTDVWGSVANTLWSGNPGSSRSEEDKAEYYQKNDLGIYNDSWYAWMKARENMTLGMPIRYGAENKYKYSETVFKVIDYLAEQYGEQFAKETLWDTDFMVDLIQRTAKALPKEYEGIWEEMANARLASRQYSGSYLKEPLGADIDPNAPIKTGKRLIMRTPINADIPDAGSWIYQGVSRGAGVNISDSSISGMSKAFANSMSNVKVIMDRETVGRLIADAVSRQIAREIQ